jgi:hypothetical protein
MALGGTSPHGLLGPVVHRKQSLARICRMWLDKRAFARPDLFSAKSQGLPVSTVGYRPHEWGSVVDDPLPLGQ